jgi:hypothetical protein
MVKGGKPGDAVSPGQDEREGECEVKVGRCPYEGRSRLLGPPRTSNRVY